MKRIVDIMMYLLMFIVLVLLCLVLYKQYTKKEITQKIIQPTLDNHECYEVTYKKEKYKVCGTDVKEKK